MSKGLTFGKDLVQSTSWRILSNKEKHWLYLKAVHNLRKDYINQELLSKPELTNQVVGVLARFLKEPVILMADVEPMYNQIMAPLNQQAYLKISM